MWISPILAFDNYLEAKKYYRGIIETHCVEDAFECSNYHSLTTQKELMADYLTILACPKDARNVIRLGLLPRHARKGLCDLIRNITCGTYNSKLLYEVCGDAACPFGRVEFHSISPSKPMWSFQNRRDYLVMVLSKHTTIPYETLLGLDGAKMLEDHMDLVEWCRSLLGNPQPILPKYPNEPLGLCAYAYNVPGGIDTKLQEAFRIFLKPHEKAEGYPNWSFPFGGWAEFSSLVKYSAPWEEPKRKAFLQRIVRYYDAVAGKVIQQYVSDKAKGIGAHPDYQAYLNERRKWCKALRT